jgi:flagellar biosynthesis/type III secretory pathway chaperone
MDNEFVNLYIENLVKEVQESVKQKMILQTHLDYLQKQNAVLNKTVEELEAKALKKTQKVSKEETF